MALKRISILIGIFIVLISGYPSWGEDWTLLDQNESGKHYYDRESIRKNNQDHILVRMLEFPDPEIIRAAEELLPYIKGFSHMINEIEIDCQRRVYLLKRACYLNKEARLIYDSRDKEAKFKPIVFRPIPRDTVIDKLSQIVCQPVP